MRKLVVFAGVAIVVLLGTVFAFLALIDINQFRPQIQATLEKQLGRPVALGTMALRYVPLSIRIADVSIGEDPAFKTGRTFVSAGEVSVSAGLLPLLRRELHIRSFVLRDPAIELVQDRAGKWNFSSLGAGAGAEGKRGGNSESALSIAEFRVENGTLAVGKPGAPRQVYRNINISLTGFAPGRPLQLQLAAALPEKSGSILVNAAGGPLDAKQPRFTGRVEIRQAGIGALRKFFSAGSIDADGILDGTVDFQLNGRLLSARPRLAIEEVRIDGKSLGRRIQIEGDLAHDLDSGLLRTAGTKVLAGGVPVAIAGEVDTRRSRADLTLRTSGAPVGELLALAAAFGAAATGGSGTLTLDARVRGPLDNLSQLELLGEGTLRDAALQLPSLTQPFHVRAANLKFAGQEATLGGLVCSLGSSTLRGSASIRNFAAPSAGFDLEIDKLDVTEMQKLPKSAGAAPEKRGSAKPGNTLRAKGKLAVGSLQINEIVLKQVRADCSFDGGVLALAPLTAGVFGGKQTGAITVDLRSEPAAISVNTKFDSVDANQLLSATTSLKQVIFGMLAATGDASMRLLPGAEGTRTLNGKLGINLANGRLGGINLMNELATVGRFVGMTTKSPQFTDLLGLTGDVLVRNGVATSENLLLQMTGGSLAAAGVVNLVDESLNLRLTAVLARETSQRAGGSKIGGYLTTALINNQGEIVIPAVLTGTLAKPRFAPDAARFAEMKLKSAVPSAASALDLVKGKTTGKAVLESILGKTGEKASPQPASPAAPAETAEPKRKGLLDALKIIREKTAPPPASAPAPPQ